MADKMHTCEAKIEVDVPIRVAYNQWTQFEEFPRFMQGVEQVEQTDDSHLHWVASVAGRRKEWDAEILEQEPDRVVSWRSTSGAMNSGSVSFTSLGVDRCRVEVIMTYSPEDFVEKVGDLLGAMKMRLHGDLKRFKEYIEERGVESGAWKGEIHGGKVKSRTHGQRFGEAKDVLGDDRSPEYGRH